MPRYLVPVKILDHTEYEVEADNETDAEHKALSMAESDINFGYATLDGAVENLDD